MQKKASFTFQSHQKEYLHYFNLYGSLNRDDIHFSFLYWKITFSMQKNCKIDPVSSKNERKKTVKRYYRAHKIGTQWENPMKCSQKQQSYWLSSLHIP